MPLERLDASWRQRYVEQASSGHTVDAASCVFCALANAPMDEASGVVDRDATTFVVLNAFPYGSGHVLVLPRRHLAAIEELDEGESAGLWRATTRALRAVTAAYRPDGANLGANLGQAAGAGIPGHLHLHVLPRWGGDTNFMTSVAETRVLPESLEVSFAKLRAAYEALD
jgi:diadenosine tetraphosphate (Ap4A) HIT family hydrolase